MMTTRRLNRSLLCLAVLSLTMTAPAWGDDEVFYCMTLEPGTRYYTFYDHVNVRARPDKASSVVEQLRVATAVDIVAQTRVRMVMDGYEAPWYEVKTPLSKGYIWGGLIASWTVRGDFDGDEAKDTLMGRLSSEFGPRDLYGMLEEGGGRECLVSRGQIASTDPFATEAFIQGRGKYISWTGTPVLVPASEGGPDLLYLRDKNDKTEGWYYWSKGKKTFVRAWPGDEKPGRHFVQVLGPVGVNRLLGQSWVMNEQSLVQSFKEVWLRWENGEFR